MFYTQFNIPSQWNERGSFLHCISLWTNRFRHVYTRPKCNSPTVTTLQSSYIFTPKAHSLQCT